MKKLFRAAITVLLLIPAFTVSAQVEETKGKPNVFIDYFWRPNEVPFSWAENLRSNVIEGLQSTGRIELLDVDVNSALAVEQSRRESGNLSAGDDMTRLAVMTQEGANFLIQGRIAAITTKYNTPEKGDPYYTAVVDYTIKVVNPADGKLIATKNFKHGAGIAEFVTGKTPEESVARANGYAKGAMKKFVDDVFKITGTVLEINESKKGEAKSVYISVGSDHGVMEGNMMRAFIVREVAGRQSKKEIGELKIKAVEGGDLALCEVKKGGKEIQAAIEGGQVIMVESMPKKANLFEKAANAVDSL